MTQTTTLAKTTDNKLQVAADGKICRGCCGGSEHSVDWICEAYPAWQMPESITVDLSGLSIASDWQYWLDGDSSGVTWCNYSWDGFRRFTFQASDINGTYVIPMSATRCSGSLDVPFASTVYVEDYYASSPQVDDEGEAIDCSCTREDSLMKRCPVVGFTITVFAKKGTGDTYLYKVEVVTYGTGDSDDCEIVYDNSYYSIPIVNTLFEGYSEAFPMSPEEDRAGTNVGAIENDLTDAYECIVDSSSECNIVNFVPAWGGQVTLTQSEEVHQYPIHLEYFDSLTYNETTNRIIAMAQFSVSELPNTSPWIRVKYKFTCNGREYIGEVEKYLGSVSSRAFYLQLPLEPNETAGYVTAEILSVTCDALDNLYWDTDSDEVANLVTGVFE